MAELELEIPLSYYSVTTSHPNTTRIVNIQSIHFESSLPSGTFVGLDLSVGCVNNDVDAGDLIDASATYRITFEKVIS